MVAFIHYVRAQTIFCEQKTTVNFEMCIHHLCVDRHFRLLLICVYSGSNLQLAYCIQSHFKISYNFYILVWFNTNGANWTTYYNGWFVLFSYFDMPLLPYRSIVVNTCANVTYSLGDILRSKTLIKCLCKIVLTPCFFSFWFSVQRCLFMFYFALVLVFFVTINQFKSLRLSLSSITS